MRNIFVFFGALLLVDGVFGVDETLSVMEGDSVTLKPYSVIPDDDTGLWKFGEEIIAKMNKAAGLFSTSDGDKVGFKGRLKLDKLTGSLTITNIRTNHTGLYKQQIRSLTETFKIFNVTVSGASGVNTDEVKSVSVMKGDTVPLFADVKIQEKDQVRLMFRGTCIADLKGPVDSSWSNIHVNDKTGDIIDAQSNQTGDYKLEINTSSWSLHRKFHINISEIREYSFLEILGIVFSVFLVIGIIIIIFIQWKWGWDQICCQRPRQTEKETPKRNETVPLETGD